MAAEKTDLRQRPVGVFDSGVGGLSVWREIVRLLPHESTLYLADQARAPYGGRTQAEVAALTHAAVAWLLQQGAKMIVVACNTASAAALESLRKRWPEAPIVGMEPAVKPASQASQTGRVGVLATPGTLRAQRFQNLVARYANGVEVHTVIGAGLVSLVERGQLDGPEIRALLQSLLQPLRAASVDHLVLGCTHFPFLAPVIQEVLGPDVTLVDPAPAVARQTWRRLHQEALINEENTVGAWRFATTGDLDAFYELSHRLLADELVAGRHAMQFRHLDPAYTPSFRMILK
ncbi:MAG: glutamate racemase [Clostridia bacterium]|nr:MAG: glutamate racemase [Clostridia bacterium]